MVPRERLAVCGALVAEQGAKLGLAAGGFDQQHPVEVPALMPEMAEQRAIGLVEVLPLPFALPASASVMSMVITPSRCPVVALRMKLKVRRPLPQRVPSIGRAKRSSE